MAMMVSARINGGLGNQLFQHAAAFHYAVKHGATFCYSDYAANHSPHSHIKYKDNIFLRFHESKFIPDSFFNEQARDCLSYRAFNRIAARNHLQLRGYFQSEHYVEPDFIRLLNFGDPFEYLKNTAFIHVRRGDYVGNKIHDLNLSRYQERAIAQMRMARPNTQFIVLSNDFFWCQEQKAFEGMRVIRDMDEIDTLKTMMACQNGGICANSTFSWWGAYLNQSPDALIFQPNRWLDCNWPQNIQFKRAIKVRL